MRAPFDHRYSHIVVGAGAAGCVLAARLSEDPRNTVLLLERGPFASSMLVDMPAAISAAIASRRFSETFVSDDRRGIAQIQGRAVGGSSVVNGMMYLRGHPADYDAWAEDGCAGWSYPDVLPYFTRAEEHASRTGRFHGSDGPLGVETPAAEKLFGPQRAFLKAGIRTGYPETDDFNGDLPEGFGLYDRTVRAGMRVSAAKAYLEPARQRPNLTILPDAKALSLKLAERRVEGVWVQMKDRTALVRGDEVILTAGAYASPHLLMLSGIGDAEELRRAGVDPVLHLPGVGRNLQNHPSVIVVYEARTADSLLPLTKVPSRVLHGLQWLLTRRGPFARNHLEVGALLRSSPHLDRPDLQIIFTNLAIDRSRMKPFPFHSYQAQIVLLQPESRGEVCLRAGDANRPLVRLNYLAAESDRRALRSGMKIMRSLAATQEMAATGREIVPGDSVTEDREIDGWIADNIGSLFHPSGTCRMGAADDPRAVVDPALKVRGIENLRVADASVMPTVTAGNTYAPTIMIAEKAADIVRGLSRT